MVDKLDDENELLFRQVHPSFVIDGKFRVSPFTRLIKTTTSSLWIEQA